MIWNSSSKGGSVYCSSTFYELKRERGSLQVFSVFIMQVKISTPYIAVIHTNNSYFQMAVSAVPNRSFSGKELASARERGKQCIY